MSEPTYGPADLAREIAVPRETAESLETYFALLADWSTRINLIGPKELEHFWKRHALDCAQLLALAPNARRWLDLGSGAGLPGLIIAIMLKGTDGAEVHLVEATAKKTRFLQAVVDDLALPAKVFNMRIDDFWAAPARRGEEGAKNANRYDVVTARALAPLNRLIGYAKPALDCGAQGLFHKGATLDAELAAAQSALRGGGLQSDVMESLSDPRGRIIRIRAASQN